MRHPPDLDRLEEGCGHLRDWPLSVDLHQEPLILVERDQRRCLLLIDLDPPALDLLGVILALVERPPVQIALDQACEED
jgi:hypothetical protein